MISPWQQWIVAAVLAIIIASIAFHLRALAPSGAITAVVLGTVVVGSGGWWAGIILVAFFATSSLVSQINPASTLDQARGSRRDWMQVIANGWGMLAGTLLYAITGWQPWLFFGIGAIAAATADTWSSEIGRSSIASPRLVTTWQSVPRGTSGAVSVRGLAASITGAALIALIAGIAIRQGGFPLLTEGRWIIVGVIVGGFVGAIIDSLLGATIQEQRFCDACNGRTESNPHRCGTPTRHIEGIRGVNNDVVNFLCVLTGALIGMFSGIL